MILHWVELLGCNIIHNLLQDWQGFWHDSQDFASVWSSQALWHLQQTIYTSEEVLVNCQNFRSDRKPSWITKQHLQGEKKVNQRPWMILNCKADRELCLNTQVDWSKISGSRVNPKLELLRFLSCLGKWQEYYMAKHLKYTLFSLLDFVKIHFLCYGCQESVPTSGPQHPKDLVVSPMGMHTTSVL